MSVIGLLKTKLLNIKREIQFSSPSSENKNAKEWLGKGPPGVNAGGDLLLYFQQQWEEMRGYSQCIVADCKDIEKLVSTSLRIDQAYSQLNALHTQLSSLPDVTATVEQTCVVVGNIQEKAEEVHTALELLEDAIEQEETRVKQAAVLRGIANHCSHNDSKLTEARAAREASLQRRRTQKLQAEAKVAAERQQVFDDAFRSDVQYYQEHGKPDDLVKREQTSKLEDIVLDSDSQGLDEFLIGQEQEQAESSSDTQEEGTADESEKVSTKIHSPETAETT